MRYREQDLETVVCLTLGSPSATQGAEYVGVVGEPGGKLRRLIPETARVVSGILEAPTPNASLVANRRGHGKGSRDGTVPALRNGNLGCVVHVCGLLVRQVLFSWGGVEIVLCFQVCCVRVVVAVKSPYGLGFEKSTESTGPRNLESSLWTLGRVGTRRTGGISNMGWGRWRTRESLSAGTWEMVGDADCCSRRRSPNLRLITSHPPPFSS